jgi:hypothetical protein
MTLSRAGSRSSVRKPSRRKKLSNGQRESLKVQHLKSDDEIAVKSAPSPSPSEESKLRNEPSKEVSSPTTTATATPPRPAALGRGIALPGLGSGFNPAALKAQLKKSNGPTPSLSNPPKSASSNSIPTVANNNNSNTIARPPLKRSLTVGGAPSAAEGAKLQGKEALLEWAKKCTANYENVNVMNFTTSWSDGLAFAALVHNYRPSSLDFKSLVKENKEQNLQIAFDAAEKLGVPKLLGKFISPHSLCINN